jgi:hypothetical protein
MEPATMIGVHPCSSVVLLSYDRNEIRRHPELMKARVIFSHRWTQINTDMEPTTMIGVHPCSSVVLLSYDRNEIRRHAELMKVQGYF